MNCAHCIWHDYNMLFSGGRAHDSLKTHGAVINWNCLTQELEPLPSLNMRRECHTMVTVKQFLFVVGGWSGTKHRMSIEMLNLDKFKT
mmetsp:Transcript_95681/g.206444  ORF Transcript_95681/g.206444 Transcript_95681/m.206444 type:complete len:88 (-) Transcript_95681:581-844(-)